MSEESSKRKTPESPTLPDSIPSLPRDRTKPRTEESSNESRDTTPTEGSDVEMELAVPPPTHMVTGSQLNSPVVVMLKWSKGKAPKTPLSHHSQSLGGIWAYLSLMSSDGQRSLAPPSTELLLGQPVASLHGIPVCEDQNEAAFAYAKFSGLAITVPGQYCFKINVVDMQSARTGTAAKVLPALHTESFDVVDKVDEARVTASDLEVEKAIARLKTMGLDF